MDGSQPNSVMRREGELVGLEVTVVVRVRADEGKSKTPPCRTKRDKSGAPSVAVVLAGAAFQDLDSFIELFVDCVLWLRVFV
jgi:hypothetical protein